MGRTAGIATLVLLAVAGAAGAMAAAGTEDGTAAAKPLPQRGAPGLLRYDANKDQAVTLDEFLKRRVDAFSKLDKNSDGSLEAADLDKAPAGFRQQRQDRRMERMLSRLDTNTDGKLTKAEFDAGPAGQTNSRRSTRGAARRSLMFSFYDRNGDGVIEKAEFEAGRGEEAEFSKRRRMHALDRDGDGKVTLEEYTADARFRFMRLDLDRDGRITAADLPPPERQRWAQR